MINVDEEISLAYLLDPAFQLVNTAGKPLTDGWLEVYIHGTRNKYYCYKDWDKEFLHPFKIPLDSLGSNIVLASPAHAYDIYVYNKFGSLIMSRYNIVPVTGDGTVIKDDVNITSEDRSVNINTSVDSATNTKTFDLSVKGVSEYTVAHDGTMTGEGTGSRPLSIQSALDVSNANTAPKYDSTSVYPTIGTLCTYGNVLYRNKVAINEAEEWNAEHWEVYSVASELKELKASPTWVNITSKLGNYDGTDTVINDRRMTIKYSRKLALINISGYITPTTSGDNVKLFSFNTDIVPFNISEYFTKSGRYVLYVSLTPYDVHTDFRQPYSITARDVTYKQNIELQIMCPLYISTDEFDAYLASH